MACLCVCTDRVTTPTERPPADPAGPAVARAADLKFTGAMTLPHHVSLSHRSSHS
jgi:hypothetical protein